MVNKTCGAYQICETIVNGVDVGVSVFLDNLAEFTANVVHIIA